MCPYQFASNSPLANIDIDGLERYYVADGRYGGKYGTSNEMRIISSNDKTLKDFSAFRQVHKDSESKVPIFQGSVPFHEADRVAQQSVTKKIFSGNKFGELDKVIIENSPDSDKGMSVPKSHEMELTVNVGLNRNGEFLFDNYYNFKNVLFHERKHLDGFENDGFSHFEIAIAQTKRISFKKSSANFKEYMKEVTFGYLDQQAARIKDALGVAKLVGKGKEYLQSESVTKDIRKYNSNVERYNNAFGENEKPEVFK